VPLLRHTHSSPLCHTSRQTLRDSLWCRFPPKTNRPPARPAVLHCSEEYAAEIFAALLAVRLIMFLWR
jgi:hypothetical protein